MIFWIEISISFSNLCVLGQKNATKAKTWLGLKDTQAQIAHK